MMKVILKMDYADEKTKQKAMKKVSGLPGVESIALDPKDKKLTVTGMVDPIVLVGKLRKICDTWIVSAGSAKEAEKKKEEPKKEVPKKPDDNKKHEAAAQLHRPYQPYHHPYNYYYIAQPQPQPAAAMGPQSYTTYYHRTSDEDPNACVIS